MSYYDPLYPAYVSTRNQIQRTIAELEDKLKRRRQIDYKVYEQDLLKQSAYNAQRERQHQILAYEDFNRKKQLDIAQSIRRSHIYPLHLYKNTIQHENMHLDYLAKLQALRKQRQLLDRDILLSQSAYSRQLGNKKYVQEDQDDVLVKKYQDGTKIEEYNKQLQQNNKRKQLLQNQQKYISHKKSELNHEFQTQRKQRRQEQFRTPFEKLKVNDTAQKSSQIKTNHIQELNGEQFQNQKIKHNLSARKYNQSGSNFGKNRSKSPSPSPVKNNNFSSNKYRKNKSSKTLRYSKLDKSRSKVCSLQEAALKKIQNRLILSEVIYEDSQYRNIKHQETHLFMTYQNQLKLRNDIRNKLNNHPSILKKHALVF